MGNTATSNGIAERDSYVLRARYALLDLQEEDGHFEGRLTSSAFPTLACILLDLLRGKPLTTGYRNWLVDHQLPDGRYPLDPERRPSDEATRFARVVLEACVEEDDARALRDALDRIPLRDWNLWLVKLFGALAGQYPWPDLLPGRAPVIAGRIAGALMPLMPRALLAKVTPPAHLAPPAGLFRQRAFDRLFVAEQYTLAPALFLIEAHTRRRDRILRDLVTWILARQAADGSWFCVTFITAIASMALLVASDQLPDERTGRPLELAFDWLERTRNADGGHREAISLNIWDTSLAVLALLRAGTSARSPAIRRATEWLAAAQNHDGGWAFHALHGLGLPSDADDTALATLALLRANVHPVRAERGIDWLRTHQARDGSWPTYVPQAGDVGCVSVTAHAMEAMLEAGRNDAVERACRWIERKQTRDGAWDDLWLARKTYGTASALVALARAGIGDSTVIRRGLRWLESTANDDGGWGETQTGEPADSTAEQTAFAVQALRAHRRSTRRAVEWLHTRQRPDGGWDPSPIGIYWEVIGGYANPMNARVFPILALTEPVKR